MRRNHGWTWVQEVLASDWAITGFKGMHNPLRTYQCFSRYLKNGHFSENEIKTFLPEVVKYLTRDCKRRGLYPPEMPKSLAKRIKR